MHIIISNILRRPYAQSLTMTPAARIRAARPLWPNSRSGLSSWTLGHRGPIENDRLKRPRYPTVCGRTKRTQSMDHVFLLLTSLLVQRPTNPQFFTALAWHLDRVPAHRRPPPARLVIDIIDILEAFWKNGGVEISSPVVGRGASRRAKLPPHQALASSKHLISSGIDSAWVNCRISVLWMSCPCFTVPPPLMPWRACAFGRIRAPGLVVPSRRALALRRDPDLGDAALAVVGL